MYGRRNVNDTIKHNKMKTTFEVVVNNVLAKNQCQTMYVFAFGYVPSVCMIECPCLIRITPTTCDVSLSFGVGSLIRIRLLAVMFTVHFFYQHILYLAGSTRHSHRGGGLLSASFSDEMIATFDTERLHLNRGIDSES